MFPTLTHVVYGFELLMVLAGLVLLWRHVVSPTARASMPRSPLPAWDAEPTEFLMFLGLVFLGFVVGGLSSSTVVKLLQLKGDPATVFGGAGAQIGILVAVLAYALRAPSYRQQAKASIGGIVRSGVATFLISLPLIHGTAKAWDTLLRLFGIPAERQDLIRMFTEAKSPTLIFALVTLALIIAPIAEELVFRAGAFRYIRTRAPRALALLVPGLIFAALHVNWSTLEGLASFAPLLVLAVLFSVAYERTGNVGTTIVAHALFNLNTVMMIFCGLT